MSDTANRSDRKIAVEYLSTVSGMSEERIKQLVDELSGSSADSQAQPIADLPDEISKDFMLRLLYTAVDTAREMILITDAPEQIGKEKIIYANKGTAEITGYSREELIGQTPSIFQGPDTEQETIKRMVEQLSKGQRFEGETFNYRKDGSRYRVRWSIDPIRDDNGNITHFYRYSRM